MPYGPYDIDFDDSDPMGDEPDARAYDAAVRRHNKAQTWEDQNTGMTLDPLPPFGGDDTTTTGDDDDA